MSDNIKNPNFTSANNQSELEGLHQNTVASPKNAPL